MADAGDVSGIFGSVETTWERARADVYSHLLTVVLLGLVGVPFPKVSLPRFDVDALLMNPWFTFADKIGLFYLIPLLAVALILAYVLAMRAVGTFVVRIVNTFYVAWTFPGATIVSNRFVHFESLVTIASTLAGESFSGNTLNNRFWLLQRKYIVSKKDEFEHATAGAPASRSAHTYASNAAFFLVAWIAAFLWLPGSSPWIIEARRHFFSATGILTVLFLWAYYREIRTFPMLIGAQAIAIAAFVAGDTDFQYSRPDAARQQALRARVIEIKEEEAKQIKRGSFAHPSQRFQIVVQMFRNLLVEYVRGAPVTAEELLNRDKPD